MSIGANEQAAQLIDHLPPGQLDLIPVSPPPPGILPDFVHPQWRVPEFFGAITPFLVIALIMYGVRVYMKVRVLKKWGVEDTTLTLGLLTTITYFIIMSWGSFVGPIAKHGYEIHVSNALSRGGYMTILCGTFLPIPALGLVKATLFIQYYKTFNSIKWMRICVTVGLVVTGLFYTAVTITYIALMAQRPGETFADTMLSQHWADAYNFFLPPGIVGVILDWVLLILPIPAILRLHMSIYRKIGVLSIFMTGGLGAIASIVNLYYRSQQYTILPDASWDVIPITIFAHIELLCGIIAATAPTCHQLWHRHSKLVKVSTKVKTGLKSVLGISSRSANSNRWNKQAVKNKQHNLDDSAMTSEKSSPPLKNLSDDEILISRGFAVSGGSIDRSDSDTTHVGYANKFHDLEAQKPLPVHAGDHKRYF